VSLGDLGLAYQAFKVAVAVDPQHAEALNNIAVLEMRRQQQQSAGDSSRPWGASQQSASLDVARACLSASAQSNSYLFEPLYNHGIIHFSILVFVCTLSKSWNLFAQRCFCTAWGTSRMPSPWSTRA
jgi:tetratricopeptide repeat protein 8